MCARRLLGCLLVGSAALLLLLAGALGVLYLVAGPSPACKAPTQGGIEPGSSARTVLSGGQERCYLLYVPPGHDPAQPAPVVVSLHGFASNAQNQEKVPGWNRIADREGFVVVYPEGASFPLRWNAAEAFLARPADDVQFYRDLVTDLSAAMAIDPARIYVTGISNGGAMANRIACEAADSVAAIGTVAAVPIGVQGGCNPQCPVPVIAFHGTADPVVKFNGGNYRVPVLSQWLRLEGGSIGYPPVESWVAGWAERNGCARIPEALPATGDASGIRYTHCREDAEVVLYVIDEGGHTWPGGLPVPLMGKTSQDIHASELMWAFFRAHPLDRTR